MDFRSDNTAAIAPVLFDAMARANHGSAAGYGQDALSTQLNAAFCDFFETDVTAFPVSTGTAANGLALAHLCPPWGRIVAHAEAHIERDECGAVSFFTGAQLDLLPGEHAKIAADTLSRHLAAHVPSVHSSPPKVLSITQASERGAVYTIDELASLSAIARGAGMRVHMDGARFANALVALDCSPADLSWRAGVDVLCLGATKNGGYACEAVVFFDANLAADFAYRRKRAGQLGCKSRYAAAQWLAYLDPAVWRAHALHANRCAQIIASAAQPFLTVPAQTNQLFLALGDAHKSTLREQGVEFYDWGSADSAEARFVTSWQTSLADAERLAAMLSALT
jgi:threonine aldolase